MLQRNVPETSPNIKYNPVQVAEKVAKALGLSCLVLPATAVSASFPQLGDHCIYAIQLESFTLLPIWIILWVFLITSQLYFASERKWSYIVRFHTVKIIWKQDFKQNTLKITTTKFCRNSSVTAEDWAPDVPKSNQILWLCLRLSNN